MNISMKDSTIKSFLMILVFLWSIYGLFVNFAVAFFVIALCLLVFYIPLVLIHLDDLRLLVPAAEIFPATSQRIPVLATKSDKRVCIPREVNRALELFLNEVLQKFVISWHSRLDPDDEVFMDEIRRILQMSLSRLLGKLENINWADFLSTRFLPAALLHVDSFRQCRQSRNSVEQRILLAQGREIHMAVHSRKSEEVYLRNVGELIVKKLLPEQYQTSKLLTVIARDLIGTVILQTAMDTAADPDAINRLIIAWLEQDDRSSLKGEEEPEELVPFLESFGNISAEKSNLAIYPKLREILKAPSQLYYFMQYLRRESSLHFLQFCFAVDEFNEKLLNPDLSDIQKKDLQKTAEKMYQTFFSLDSSDVIDFNENIREEMEQIIYSADDIENLRKRDTLFRAYDYALDILEIRYLPRYYRSFEFFQFLSGAQNAALSGKDSKGSKGKNPEGRSSWKNKIRTAMRTSAPGWPSLEGTILNAMAPKEDLDTAVDLTEVDFIQDDSEDSEPETAGSYGDLIPICGRDLSAWRISIPRIAITKDTSGKRIHCFEIDIQRIDLRPEDDPEEYHWSVLRSYHEFYTLEAKLTEFHGNLLDLKLPAKKIFGTRNPEFLESIRLDFEGFLRCLLQQPALKSSDLIFAFLTLTDLSAAPVLTDGVFVGGTNFLPDLGFSRIIRHVPMKLRQERGQHLENFLTSFVASTEAPKPKASKSDNRESSEVSVPLFKKYHPLFQDNAATFCYDPANYSQSQTLTNPPKLDDIYEILLFFSLRILPLPEALWNVLAGLRWILSPIVENHFLNYIQAKLRLCIKTSRLLSIVSLLQGIVVEEDRPEPRKAELLERRKTAIELLEQNVPSWLSFIIGQENINQSIQQVFQCFQIPILNKQLSYVLLDLLLSELYPEDFTPTRH